MPESYWGDQAFGSYSGRVPSTGEYIGPYDTMAELEAAIADCEFEHKRMDEHPIENDDD